MTKFNSLVSFFFFFFFCFLFYQILQTFVTERDFEENHKDMINVLESIGKQMISDQNEGFALKVHYLSYLMQQYHDHGMKTLLKRWDIIIFFQAYTLNYIPTVH